MTARTTIGMTGYCHRGDHDLCPHTGTDPASWRSSGRSDDPGFGDHPDCACSCHLGPTGYCSTGNHKRCKYGAGREFPDGLVLSDGKREYLYMCPCDCHAQVDTQRPGRKRHRSAPWTTAEMQVIADNLHLSNGDLGRKLGRTADAIKHKRRALSTIKDW